MIRKLIQFFCRHDWMVCRFQALTPGTDWECKKCGKNTTTYLGQRP